MQSVTARETWNAYILKHMDYYVTEEKVMNPVWQIPVLSVSLMCRNCSLSQIFDCCGQPGTSAKLFFTVINITNAWLRHTQIIGAVLYVDFFMSGDNFFYTSMSVSYTHLDVYKRQPVYTITINRQCPTRVRTHVTLSLIHI